MQNWDQINQRVEFNNRGKTQSSEASKCKLGKLSHKRRKHAYLFKYEGLQVNINHEYIAQTTFTQRGEIRRNNSLIKTLGTTDDIITEGLTVKVNLVSSISGRDKPTKNKVCRGELRRKGIENRTLSFGLSKSKSFHKAKHSNK